MTRSGRAFWHLCCIGAAIALLGLPVKGASNAKDEGELRGQPVAEQPPAPSVSTEAAASLLLQMRRQLESLEVLIRAQTDIISAVRRKLLDVKSQDEYWQHQSQLDRAERDLAGLIAARNDLRSLAERYEAAITRGQ